MIRVVYIVTFAGACKFLQGQVSYLSQRGFEVIVVSAPGPLLTRLQERENIQIVPLTIHREIRPLRDLWTLVRLAWLLRRLRPTIVNASTAKAGLLGSLAAWLTRVPVRIYTLRGLRSETTRGLKRFLLDAAERIASACAQRVVCVSESLRRLYVKRRYASAGKTVVFGAGSSNGVDVEHFVVTDERRSAASALRRRIGIPAGATVVGFIGRLVRDKGVREMIAVFDRVRKEFPDARLLILGDFEPGDAVSEECARRLREDDHVIMPGLVPDAAPYYPLMDVIAYPSYREGFPNVPLEAAVANVPLAGFEATGVVDAVVHGETGTLVPAGDARALADAVLAYLHDPNLRARHVNAARERVLREFRRERIWEQLYREYVRLLQQQRQPHPRPASLEPAGQSTTDTVGAGER